MRKTLGIAAVIGLTSATTAFAWIAENGLVVNATGRDSFTIPYRGISAAQAFWCAAGDYTIRQLNLPGTTQIFRTSSVPRRAGQPMSFSFDSSNSVGETGIAVLGRRASISASHARTLCDIDAGI